MLTVLILTGFWTGVTGTTSYVEAADHAESIRHATGLRFAVFESYIRRNIIRTRTPYGLKIKAVDAESPGARSGLEKGDILLKWNGEPVRKLEPLRTWIDKSRGERKPVKITVARRKKKAPRWSRRPWETIETTITPRSLW